MRNYAPTRHKTVQSRILAHAQDIGWRFVPRAEAEARRGVDQAAVTRVTIEAADSVLRLPDYRADYQARQRDYRL